MMRRQFHAPQKMTKAQNRLAFMCWLTGCTDSALNAADPKSISRSYGLDVRDVVSAIAGQRVARRCAQ